MKNFIKKLLINVGLLRESPITLFPEGTGKFWWETSALEFVNIAASKIWAVRMGQLFRHTDSHADVIEKHKAEIEDWLADEEEKFAYRYKGVRK